jgi:hypothetical protein
MVYSDSRDTNPETNLILGKVYPIDEVAIRIQGGSPQGGICTPVWMELLVSDDGHLYRLSGEYAKETKTASVCRNMRVKHGCVY